jgi:hypothetical protein
VDWHSVPVAASWEYVHVRVSGHRNRARWPLKSPSDFSPFSPIFSLCDRDTTTTITGTTTTVTATTATAAQML